MDDERTESTLRGRDLAGLGGLLAGAVIVGMVLGLLLDAHNHSSPTYTLIGIAAGIVVGAVAFWVRVRAALRD
ncbi:MAG: AtpZ/AtpI family protein [Actinomycetota bacterium]|nr:AtpZ/AtpI family protein [Actinomycetota bacterium]